MKLLFNHNLSPRLVQLLADLHPDSQHVYSLGMDQDSDRLDPRAAMGSGLAEYAPLGNRTDRILPRLQHDRQLPRQPHHNLQLPPNTATSLRNLGSLGYQTPA